MFEALHYLIWEFAIWGAVDAFATFSSACQCQMSIARFETRLQQHQHRCMNKGQACKGLPLSSTCGVSTLYHESSDVPMEQSTIIYTAGTESQEVLC